MCDTQVIRAGGGSWFAKNSDREPDEPQLIDYIPPVRGDRSAWVDTTYIRVAQVPDRHGLILSRPAWLWGAEIGVNDRGLVMGNEAVFTRCIDRSGQALLGMDILRLALERCVTAGQAIDCIDDLLQRYGQGGPAGYRDKRFRYDNSFIIADPQSAWKLETAGRHWAASRIHHRDAISNCLTIGSDFDRHSAGLHDFARVNGRYRGDGPLDFARAFDTRFMKTMGRAAQRRRCSLAGLAAIAGPGLRAMAGNLRLHRSDNPDFARHHNDDVCMHAAGRLRPHQTTGSMVVHSGAGQPPEIFLTGTSAPCLSLFQPISFAQCALAPPPLVGPTGSGAASLWHQFETVHHAALLDIGFRRELQGSRDELESVMFDPAVAIERRSAAAADWHGHWHAEAGQRELPPRRRSAYHRYWLRKSRALRPA